VHHDIDEARVIRPSPGDVLLGHPHEAPWSIFRRSAARPGWRRKLMLMPYVHVDAYHASLADPVVRQCDLFLAITGSTWFESVSSSITAHWLPKMVHVDLAVDRADFPRVKTAFNPPGRRRFLYIGHTGWYKNTPYLEAVAARLPEFAFGWIGSGEGKIGSFEEYGRRDFADPEARRLVADYDFLLTVGVGDANPTTVLEAMAWGLVPVCTPESGYAGRAGIVNVPLGDSERAAAILQALQARPEADLLELQAANDGDLDAHFNWDRFTDQVVAAIESDESPACLPIGRGRAFRLRWLSGSRQASVLGPSQLRSSLRSLAAGSPVGRRLLEARARRRGA
jgi:glycosyltransferase involved in cell wall biosynthesis